MKIIESAFYKIPVLLILAGIFLFPTSAYAAKKHFLDSLSGSWKGKGFVVTSAGAKEEAIRCRLRNRTDTKKAKLTITGSCGIGGVLIPMNGWIQQKGNSSRYLASLFKSLAFLRIDSFTGKRSGKKLRLRFKGKDKINKDTISVAIAIISRGKNRFDIQLSSTDVKTKRQFKVGTVKFSRN